jgi:cytochrome P450
MGRFDFSSVRLIVRYHRAIHRDPGLWPNPDAFDPSRYLNHSASASDYINASDPTTRDHFSYGAGRRVCPGVHVAERSLFINIARVLWGFKLSRKMGKDGKVIEVTEQMAPGFFSVPEKFECDIRPRGWKRVEVMRKEWEKAEGEGLNF